MEEGSFILFIPICSGTPEAPWLCQLMERFLPPQSWVENLCHFCFHVLVFLIRAQYRKRKTPGIYWVSETTQALTAEIGTFINTQWGKVTIIFTLWWKETGESGRDRVVPALVSLLSLTLVMSLFPVRAGVRLGGTFPEFSVQYCEVLLPLNLLLFCGHCCCPHPNSVSSALCLMIQPLPWPCFSLVTCFASLLPLLTVCWNGCLHLRLLPAHVSLIKVTGA